MIYRDGGSVARGGAPAGAMERREAIFMEFVLLQTVFDQKLCDLCVTTIGCTMPALHSNNRRD